MGGDIVFTNVRIGVLWGDNATVTLLYILGYRTVPLQLAQNIWAYEISTVQPTLWPKAKQFTRGRGGENITQL